MVEKLAGSHHVILSGQYHFVGQYYLILLKNEIEHVLVRWGGESQRAI